MRTSTLTLVLVLGFVLTAAPAVYGMTEMYVSSGGDVLRYDAETGTPLPAPSQSGAIFATGLTAAHGLEIGPDYNGDGKADLYVVEKYGDQQLDIFSGIDGTLLVKFGNGWSSPRGVAIGPDLNAYVNIRNDNKVVKVALPAGTESDFASAGLNNGSDCEWIGGRLWAVGENDDCWVYDAAGNLVTTVKTASGVTTFGEISVTGGPDGMVYFGGRNDTFVKVFDPVNNTYTGVLSTADGLGISYDDVRGISFGPDLNGDGVQDLYIGASGATYGTVYAVDIQDKVVTGTFAGNPDTEMWVYIAPVPEPATMSLLVLGATALLRRRRS